MFSYFPPCGTMPLIVKGQSRAINAENPRGEKGGGGKAASNLGVGRKGSPCLRHIPSGETVVLGEIEGSGIITHMWMTDHAPGPLCAARPCAAHLLGRQ